VELKAFDWFWIGFATGLLSACAVICILAMLDCRKLRVYRSKGPITGKIDEMA